MDPHLIRRALLHLRRCSDFDTIGCMYDNIYFRYITTESGGLTLKRCYSSALFFLIAELEIKFLHWKKNTNILPPETSTFVW